MRDTIKNEDYFQQYLDFLNKTIEKFETLSKSYNERKGDKPLRKYYMDKINLLYSSGANILEIKKIYPIFLDHFIHSWRKEDGYEILLNTISLAVLLNIPKDSFTDALKFLKKEDANDFVIDFLVNSIDDSWRLRDNDVKFPIRYAMLKDIIESKNSKLILRDYLNKWYKLHEDAAWYDNHKSKEDIYTGYWAYEAGAIAKILNLNDEELKEQQYYPYDLVHFRD